MWCLHIWGLLIIEYDAISPSSFIMGCLLIWGVINYYGAISPSSINYYGVFTYMGLLIIEYCAISLYSFIVG